jgi:hypothetical protein
MVVDGTLFCFFLTLTAWSPFHSRWLPGSHREIMQSYAVPERPGSENCLERHN